MKKQWKLDNKGMTLLEVIVAFAIFAIAATILITGFNGALKVMGNSEKIKNASQENTGKLNAVGASALEEFEGLKNSEITETKGSLSFTSDYSVPGIFYTATSTEKTDMNMKMFQPDGSALVVPTVEIPKKEEDEKDVPDPVVPDEGENVGYNDEIFNSAGHFNKNLNNYNIGVITNQQKLAQSSQSTEKVTQIRQLYFTAQPIAIQVKNTSVPLDIDFLYIGGNLETSENSSSLILTNNASLKETNKNAVLLYFNQKTTIGSTIGVEKGYYLLNAGEKGVNILTMTKEKFDAFNIKNKTIAEQKQIVSNYVTDLFKGN